MIPITAMIGATVLWKQANATFAAVYVWVVFAITVRYANETPPTQVSSSLSLLWACTALSKMVTIVLWILTEARQWRNLVAMDSNGTMAYCLCKPAAILANCQRHIVKACLVLIKAVF